MCCVAGSATAIKRGQHNTEVDPMVRALKILVAVLGIMLVGGIVALVVLLATRGRPSTPRPVASVPHGTAYDAVINVPAGAHVVSAQADGARLVVVLALADGSQQILLLDPASGARLGTIELRGGAN
jgi:hypothetical protein